MPRLELRAQNISGHRAALVLLGRSPKTDEDKRKYKADPRDLTIEWVTIETVNTGNVEPGDEIIHAGEIDYDAEALCWIVPFGFQNRFWLKSFTWGGRPLIKQHGLI